MDDDWGSPHDLGKPHQRKMETSCLLLFLHRWRQEQWQFHAVSCGFAEPSGFVVATITADGRYEMDLNWIPHTATQTAEVSHFPVPVMCVNVS